MEKKILKEQHSNYQQEEVLVIESLESELQKNQAQIDLRDDVVNIIKSNTDEIFGEITEKFQDTRNQITQQQILTEGYLNNIKIGIENDIQLTKQQNQVNIETQIKKYMTDLDQKFTNLQTQLEQQEIKAHGNFISEDKVRNIVAETRKALLVQIKGIFDDTNNKQAQVNSQCLNLINKVNMDNQSGKNQLKDLIQEFDKFQEQTLISWEKLCSSIMTQETDDKPIEEQFQEIWKTVTGYDNQDHNILDTGLALVTAPTSFKKQIEQNILDSADQAIDTKYNEVYANLTDIMNRKMINLESRMNTVIKEQIEQITKNPLLEKMVTTKNTYLKRKRNNRNTTKPKMGSQKKHFKLNENAEEYHYQEYSDLEIISVIMSNSGSEIDTDSGEDNEDLYHI